MPPLQITCLLDTSTGSGSARNNISRRNSNSAPEVANMASEPPKQPQQPAVPGLFDTPQGGGRFRKNRRASKFTDFLKNGSEKYLSQGSDHSRQSNPARRASQPVEAVTGPRPSLIKEAQSARALSAVPGPRPSLIKEAQSARALSQPNAAPKAVPALPPKLESARNFSPAPPAAAVPKPPPAALKPASAQKAEPARGLSQLAPAPKPPAAAPKPALAQKAESARGLAQSAPAPAAVPKPAAAAPKPALAQKAESARGLAQLAPAPRPALTQRAGSTRSVSRPTAPKPPSTRNAQLARDVQNKSPPAGSIIGQTQKPESPPDVRASPPADSIIGEPRGKEGEEEFEVTPKRGSLTRNTTLPMMEEVKLNIQGQLGNTITTPRGGEAAEEVNIQPMLRRSSAFGAVSTPQLRRNSGLGSQLNNNQNQGGRNSVFTSQSQGRRHSVSGGEKANFNQMGRNLGFDGGSTQVKSSSRNNQGLRRVSIAGSELSREEYKRDLQRNALVHRLMVANEEHYGKMFQGMKGRADSIDSNTILRKQQSFAQLAAKEVEQRRLREEQEEKKKEQERSRRDYEARKQQQQQKEAQERAQQKAQQKAKLEAQLKAQQEVHQRAHLEAKRVQQEAQQRAQQAAQHKAQLEAQLAAKRRAEEEAQKGAQQEAQQRAELEALQKAHLESQSDAASEYEEYTVLDDETFMSIDEFSMYEEETVCTTESDTGLRATKAETSDLEEMEELTTNLAPLLESPENQQQVNPRVPGLLDIPSEGSRRFKFRSNEEAGAFQKNIQMFKTSTTEPQQTATAAAKPPARKAWKSPFQLDGVVRTFQKTPRFARTAKAQNQTETPENTDLASEYDEFTIPGESEFEDVTIMEEETVHSHHTKESKQEPKANRRPKKVHFDLEGTELVVASKQKEQLPQSITEETRVKETESPSVPVEDLKLTQLPKVEIRDGMDLNSIDFASLDPEAIQKLLALTVQRKREAVAGQKNAPPVEKSKEEEKTKAPEFPSHPVQKGVEETKPKATDLPLANFLANLPQSPNQKQAKPLASILASVKSSNAQEKPSETLSNPANFPNAISPLQRLREETKPKPNPLLVKLEDRAPRRQSAPQLGSASLAHLKSQAAPFQQSTEDTKTPSHSTVEPKTLFSVEEGLNKKTNASSSTTVDVDAYETIVAERERRQSAPELGSASLAYLKNEVAPLPQSKENTEAPSCRTPERKALFAAEAGCSNAISTDSSTPPGVRAFKSIVAEGMRKMDNSRLVGRNDDCQPSLIATTGLGADKQVSRQQSDPQLRSAPLVGTPSSAPPHQSGQDINKPKESFHGGQGSHQPKPKAVVRVEPPPAVRKEEPLKEVEMKKSLPQMTATNRRQSAPQLRAPKKLQLPPVESSKPPPFFAYTLFDEEPEEALQHLQPPKRGEVLGKATLQKSMPDANSHGRRHSLPVSSGKSENQTTLSEVEGPAASGVAGKLEKSPSVAKLRNSFVEQNSVSCQESASDLCSAPKKLEKSPSVTKLQNSLVEHNSVPELCSAPKRLEKCPSVSKLRNSFIVQNSVGRQQSASNLSSAPKKLEKSSSVAKLQNSLVENNSVGHQQSAPVQSEPKKLTKSPSVSKLQNTLVEQNSTSRRLSASDLSGAPKKLQLPKVQNAQLPTMFAQSYSLGGGSRTKKKRTSGVAAKRPSTGKACTNGQRQSAAGESHAPTTATTPPPDSTRVPPLLSDSTNGVANAKKTMPQPHSPQVPPLDSTNGVTNAKKTTPQPHSPQVPPLLSNEVEQAYKNIDNGNAAPTNATTAQPQPTRLPPLYAENANEAEEVNKGSDNGDAGVGRLPPPPRRRSGLKKDPSRRVHFHLPIQTARVAARRSSMPTKPAFDRKSPGNTRMRRHSFPERPTTVAANPQVPSLLDAPKLEECTRFRRRSSVEKPSAVTMFQQKVKETNSKGEKLFWGRRVSEPDLRATPQKVRLPRVKSTELPPMFADTMDFFDKATTVGI